MHKAAGFQRIKQFQHKAKVRRNAARILSLQCDQTTQLTAWAGLMNTTRRVDTDRVNWKGYIVYSQMVYDGRPRLVRRLK